MIAIYEDFKRHIKRGQPFTITEKIDEIWPNLAAHERRSRVATIYGALAKDVRWGNAEKVGMKKKHSCGHTVNIIIWVIK